MEASLVLPEGLIEEFDVREVQRGWFGNERESAYFRTDVRLGCLVLETDGGCSAWEATEASDEKQAIQMVRVSSCKLCRTKRKQAN